MKILVYGINYSPELTGIGKYTGEMVEWLAAQGHEVRVITAPPYYPQWQVGENYSAWRYKREEGAATVWRCPLYVPKQPSTLKRLLHLGSFAVSSFFPLMAQRRWKPDRIIGVVPTLFCTPGMRLLAKLSGARTVLHIQDYEVDAMLGLAGGVMVAASFWSLLSPCIDMAEELGMRPWSTALIGFMGGGFLLFWGDRAFTHFSQKREAAGKNGRSAGFKRCAMLVFSITLHNIPEGLAIGVAFGSLAYGLEGSTAVGAWMLAVGIGLQNLPEGMAVSLPLRREGLSPKKAFFCGQLSGIVEPIAAVLGAILVMHLQVCLPFLLAFAAGAMIYVVVEELIPESQTNENKDWMALFTLVGFSLMMCLDVALG